MPNNQHNMLISLIGFVLSGCELIDNLKDLPIDISAISETKPTIVVMTPEHRRALVLPQALERPKYRTSSVPRTAI